jgi:addiction module HigA family antidote
LRKLVMIDAAVVFDDLRVPPGNRLEALKGNRVGQHSIRINQQWRICFRWTGAGAENVEIVDYHQEVEQVDKISPIHPGEVLMEEFIEPLGLTQYRVAVAVGVPPRRINEIVHGKRRITADTTLRLARYFGTTDMFWINLPRGCTRPHPAVAVGVTVLGGVAPVLLRGGTRPATLVAR